MALQLWDFNKFWLVVSLIECPNVSTPNCNLQKVKFCVSLLEMYIKLSTIVLSLYFFIDLIKEYIMKHANGIYQCMKCGYESSYNTTIKRHVEARHFTTPGVPCDLCHVVCKTSNALTTHRSKFHHKQTEKIQNVN